MTTARGAWPVWTGLAFVLGQPGPDLWPLTVVALALWMWGLRRSGLAMAAAGSALIGLVNVTVLASAAVQWDPAAGALMALYYVVLFGGFGLLAWGASRRTEHALAAATGLALAWMLLELVAAHLAPVTLALSMASSPAMLWPAALGGAALLSGELVLLGAWVGLARPDERIRAGVTTAILLAAQAGVGLGLHGLMDTSGRSLKVAGVQPHIPTRDFRDRMSDPRVAEGITATYGRLAAAAATAGPDLMVFPEGGDGRYLFVSDMLNRPFRQFASAQGLDLLIPTSGVNEAGRLTNVAYLVRRDGSVDGPHVKTRPVPFGESGLAGAEMARVLTGSDAKIGTLICSEAFSRGPTRDLVDQGAELLVVVADDASFQDSWMSTWHVAFSVMRAVEAGRPLVMVANGGPSVLADAAGFVLGGAPYGEAGVFGGSVLLASKPTVFRRVEPILPLLFLGALLGLAYRAPRRRTPLAVQESVGGVVASVVGSALVAGLAWELPRVLLPPTGENVALISGAAPVWSVEDISASVRDRESAFAAATTHLLRFYGFTANPDDVSARMADLEVPINPAGAQRLLASWGLDVRLVEGVADQLRAGSGPLLGEVSPPSSPQIPALALTATDGHIVGFNSMSGAIEEIDIVEFESVYSWFVAVVDDEVKHVDGVNRLVPVVRPSEPAPRFGPPSNPAPATLHTHDGETEPHAHD
ncbi:MAG: hypothetical protein KC912_17540 [Proteobacteria bacterium]|nr:hypothetical protein [Pseudomonadota bacterium]